MTDRYAVFGNPIAHSRSPDIHAAFARETGQDMQYDKQLVERGEFEQAVDAFFADGGKGLNVTVPFKEEAFRYAAQLTERATAAGAVNTLVKQDDGTVLGDNTDGIGMVRDITERLGWSLEGKRLLLIGAGGAARGVVLPCLEQEPESITVVNRTAVKAADLAQFFADFGHVDGGGFESLGQHEFDVVINATSASLQGALPAIPPSVFAPGVAVYDMMYAVGLTPFLAWAKQLGVDKRADGLGMLVGQAAEAFYLWRGVRPSTEPVLQALRQDMAQKQPD